VPKEAEKDSQLQYALKMLRGEPLPPAQKPDAPKPDTPGPDVQVQGTKPKQK